MSASSSPRLSRLRFAALVLLGVYPLVTVVLYILTPLTAGFEVWQRTAILCPIIVVAMVWMVIPVIYRFFGRFVFIAA
ncbi:hypothetical protein [Roseibium sp.]|uniref:hypothetical protein n=1 Tax=Roseibium sp. TaxID=1936156 RepID=UPI003A9834C5